MNSVVKLFREPLFIQPVFWRMKMESILVLWMKRIFTFTCYEYAVLKVNKTLKVRLKWCKHPPRPYGWHKQRSFDGKKMLI